MVGWQECGSEILNSAVPERWVDRDETWQIFVFGTESVADPSPHAGPDKRIAPRVHLQQRSSMRFVRTMHRLDEGNIVDATSDLRKQIAYPSS